MSPEQLAGDKLDGRSDIYSLALVAFNMLTGKLPFPSDSAQESMIMRLTDRPKPLGEMRPEVSWPAEVQAVMDKALEREAATRYQNATEFGRELQRAIERMPETVAAELGTQMIQVPPTRVAAPAGDVLPRTSVQKGVVAGPGATVAVPAPVSPPSVTQAAAPAKSGNKVALVGGGVALVAAIAAAVVVPPMLKAKDSTATDSTAKTATTPTITDTAGKNVAPAGQATPNVPTSNPSPASGNSPATKQGATKSVADQLRDLIKDPGTDAQAANMLAMLAPLERQASGSNELYLVAAIRSRVSAFKGNTQEACSLLKKALEPKDLDTTLRESGQSRMENILNCPN
jgi:hypothetical protein